MTCCHADSKLGTPTSALLKASTQEFLSSLLSRQSRLDSALWFSLCSALMLKGMTVPDKG